LISATSKKSHFTDSVHRRSRQNIYISFAKSQLMSMIEESFKHLFPDKEFPYDARIKFTDHFSDYNANVRLRGNLLEFRLSKKFREVSPEIRMGLLQELMLRLFKRYRYDTSGINTMYIDLYNSFVRNLHIAIPKTDNDPVLEESFNRVNAKYFSYQVEQPNLSWGSLSFTQLGSYNYKKDIIIMSSVFKELDPLLLDSVMHHEMLHKYHKFKSNLGRNHFHDSAFRRKEGEFENHEEVQLMMKQALRSAKRRQMFRIGGSSGIGQREQRARQPKARGLRKWLFG